MVRKKIFDITPSQKEIESEFHEEAREEKTFVASPPVFPKKLIPLFAGLILLAGFSLSYFLISPKAKVELWPEKKNIEETTLVLVASIKKGANFLLGEILEAEKTVSQNFPAGGGKMKTAKAHGTIRVYNNYSAAPQALVATTRFVSDDGKLFRTPKSVVIPGTHSEGGKLVAGFGDIEVIADQPGKDYNIDASTFSIPGFAGTPKYTAFYAKSFESMVGGVKEEVSYVTQEDLDMARELLAKTALAESGAALRNLISSGEYIAIDKAISSKVIDFESSVKVGQEAFSFSARIKARSKTIALREQALKDFSRNYIQGKLAPEEKLIEKSLKIEYSPEKIDLEKNEFTMKIIILAQSHSVPEEIKIKELIKNKNLEEIRNIFKEFAGIKRAKVELWPFWVSLAPEASERIEVVLRLD